MSGDRNLRLAATAGAVGPVLWFTVMIVLGLTVPGYDTLTMPASALSLGATGWVMVVNFILLGAVEILFALGLWRAAGSSGLERAGAALIGVAGICTLVAGPLITDPNDALRTLHSQLHLAAVALAFAAVSAAAFLFARRYRAARGFASFSLLAGVSILPLFVVSEAAAPMLGLIQRVAVGIAFAWLTVLALRLRTDAMDG
jgi:Protein of unknown function (DUF998)